MTKRAIDGIFNEDCIAGVGRLADGSVDLVIADPPYGLGKDYGNDSDKLSGEAYLAWSERWTEAVLPKLARNGSLYLFCTWQYAPELFVMLKRRLSMINEIIWDRRVPSMGGSTRKFSSVHDNIGFFAASRDYYFDVDAVRIPYDAETKKARSRKRFEGKKWLEVGYNPKDVERVAPASAGPRTRRAPDAEAAGTGRAHGAGELPAGRAGAGPVPGQWHHRRGLRAAGPPVCRLRDQRRVLPRGARAGGRRHAAWTPID